MTPHFDPAPHPQLSSHLRRARQAILHDAIGRGALYASCYGGLLLVLAVLASHYWSGLRVAIWALAALGVLVAAVWPWWRVRDLLREPIVLARWIEARRPAYRNDLSSILEFSQRPAESEEAAALRGQLLQRVEGLLARSKSWQDLLPRPSHKAARFAPLIAMGVAIALMLTPSFRASFEQVAETAGGEPVVRERMLVGTLQIEVTPPSYTRLAPQTFYHVTSGFTVPEGSTLRLVGRSFEHAERAWLQREGHEDPLPVSLEDGREFEVEYQALQNHALRFGFEIGRKDFLDSTEFRASVFPDEAPVFHLHEPQGDLEVTPGQVVELRYDVRDDYGLRDVHLVWHFKGREQDAERILLLDESSGSYAEDTAPFDTAPLYMQPGDEVIVYLEARDNVSFRAPNVGRSSALTFFVQEEHRPEAEILELKELLFEDLLTQLGSLLPIPLHDVEGDGKGGFRLLPRMAETEAQNAQNLDRLEEHMQAWPVVLDRLQSILTSLESLEEPDEREFQLFATMRAGLSNHERAIARELEKLSIPRQAGAVSSGQMRNIFRQTASLIADTERAALVVEALISEHQAADVARALEELSQIRSRLRELLEEYKETRDPELRARIERELERLSKRMNELIQTLSSQVQQLPQEHFNAEAMDKSETAENVDSMADAMQSMKEMLEKGDIDAAMSAFDQLSSTLDALQNELGDPMAGADSDTLSEFDQAMGELMDEINAVEAMQQAIEEETAAMERELREEKLEEMREALNRQLDEALKTVREARERLASSEHTREDAEVDASTRNSETALENLQRRLENRDLSVAEDAALDAMEALKQLENEASRARRFSTEEDDARGLRDLETLSRKDANRMRKLAEELSELQQQLQPEPGEARQEQLQSLQERQGAAEERLGELEKKIGEVGEQFPMMNPEGDQSMEQAKQGMKESGSSLQQRRPGAARGGQRQALDGLQSMRQSMQQRMAESRKQAQQQAQREGRGRANRDDVDVAGEGDRDLRQRQQIMDAMREGALEAWDDPIRQYYESLVR